MHRALARYARLQDRLAQEFLPSRAALVLMSRLMGREDDGRELATGFHQHATLQDLVDRFGTERVDQLLTFAVVRHPVERLVSLYAHFRRNKSHPHHAMAMGMDIEAFMEWACARGGPRPQMAWLTRSDRDGIGIDRIVRFETLEEDVRRVTVELGISQLTLPPGRRKDDEERRLCSDHAIALVREAFAIDYETLGYGEDPHGERR